MPVTARDLLENRKIEFVDDQGPDEELTLYLDNGDKITIEGIMTPDGGGPILMAYDASGRAVCDELTELAEETGQYDDQWLHADSEGKLDVGL